MRQSSNNADSFKNDDSMRQSDKNEVQVHPVVSKSSNLMRITENEQSLPESHRIISPIESSQYITNEREIGMTKPPDNTAVQ